MKPEIKTFPFEVKAVDETEGMIEGYASTFGNIDLGYDIVEPGAFTKTLKESKGRIPILNNHNPWDQIGWNHTAREDENGLYVKGKILTGVPSGKARLALLKEALDIDAKAGLSIGYGTVKAEPDQQQRNIRRLKEVKLYEYSTVTFPMNEEAMVTAAKSWLFGTEKLDLKQMIELFVEKTRELGFGKEQIFEALHKHGAAGHSEDPSQLIQSLDNLINSLKTA